MTLIEKLVAGDILENDEAREVLSAILFGAEDWVLWVKLAAVYVRHKQYAQALWILDELIDKEEATNGIQKE